VGAEDDRVSEAIGRCEERKLASRCRPQTIASWVGTFGMVGWSVSVPAVVGAALGRWLDTGRVDGPSWTLTFLILGMAVGCVNAWHWVSVESHRCGCPPADCRCGQRRGDG
jgi:ATP synthase protein I